MQDQPRIGPDLQEGRPAWTVFVAVADAQILSSGPRSAEVLDALARAVYAPDGAPDAASRAVPGEPGP